MTGSDDQHTLTATIADDGRIVVRGDIDMAGGPALDQVIRDLEQSIGTASDDGRCNLVLDLGGVSFVDSSGLRTLLEAVRRASERDARVELRAVGPEVLRLLEITGTTAQFVMG